MLEIYLLIGRSAALVPHGQGCRDIAGHEIPRDVDDAGTYVSDLCKGILEEVELVGIALRALIDDLHGIKRLDK